MKLIEITNALETFAPLALQENYDNAGLLLGNHNQEISAALLCLDVTEAVLHEAITSGCNLIIAHHPVIFSGIKRLTGSNYVERILLKAIKNDIAIYAAHTNLDNVRQGVNAKIASRLELKNTFVLLPKPDQLMKLFTFVPVGKAAQVRQALFDAGAGSIGNYDACSFNSDGTGTFRGNEASNAYIGEKGKMHTEPETKIEVIFPFWLRNQVITALQKNHPYEEVAYDIMALKNPWNHTGAGIVGDLASPMDSTLFLEYLKEKMLVTIIRHTKLHTNLISKVAVCGGAGSFLLKNAIDAGADVFITADFKYHQFFDAEDRIIIADIGHFESEQFTTEIFAEVLRQKFPTFAVRFTSVNTNPINYF